MNGIVLHAMSMYLDKSHTYNPLIIVSNNLLQSSQGLSHRYPKAHLKIIV